jgi:hypothetical protein
MVTPSRLVFEENDRTLSVVLVNTGSTETTFRISLVNYLMDDNGSLVEVSDPNQGMFADQLIRFSPRQVTLPVNVPQTIRIQIQRPANLPEGEYRSHMFFRAVPSDESTAESILIEGGDGVDVRLTPLYGISIPIIVRHGKTEVQIGLKNLEIVRQSETTHLMFDIIRTGNRSVYGDISVIWQQGGEEYVIGMILGIAVYTPNDVRKINMELKLPPQVELSDGRLTVKYEERPEQKERQIAEAFIYCNNEGVCSVNP